MADRSLCCAHLLSFPSLTEGGVWTSLTGTGNLSRSLCSFISFHLILLRLLSGAYVSGLLRIPDDYLPCYYEATFIPKTCALKPTRTWTRPLHPPFDCIFSHLLLLTFCASIFRTFSYRQHIAGSDHLQLLPGVSRPHTCAVIQSD